MDGDISKNNRKPDLFHAINRVFHFRDARGLWRGPGRAGAALFTFAAYLGAVISPGPHAVAGACIGPPRHLSSRPFDYDRSAAVLGWPPDTLRSASRDARRERRRGGPPATSAHVRCHAPTRDLSHHRRFPLFP